MNDEQTFTTSEDEAFEKIMNAALDRAPEPVIPSDFAARVAAKAAAMPKRSALRQPRYGQRIAFAAMFVLGIVLFALAPHVTPSLTNGVFLMEMLVLLQLGGLVYWLTKSRQQQF